MAKPRKLTEKQARKGIQTAGVAKFLGRSLKKIIGSDRKFTSSGPGPTRSTAGGFVPKTATPSETPKVNPPAVRAVDIAEKVKKTKDKGKKAIAVKRLRGVIRDAKNPPGPPEAVKEGLVPAIDPRPKNLTKGPVTTEMLRRRIRKIRKEREAINN